MKKKLVVLVLCFAFAKALVAQSTVVELFTSQGCSSCPPADALVADIQEQYGEEVITLSYHVDYWDYIGWKDPFASSAYTQRQYDYATAFRSRQVYTPQAVINGNSHFTGSDSRKMTQALRTNKLEKRENLQLGEINKVGDKLFITYAMDGTAVNAISFALTLKERVTQVKRGENRNRTLRNHNIVIDYTEISPQKEGSIQLQIPAWVSAEDELAVVAYVTKNNVGITSAIRKELASS